jgi:hypothetical protein
MTLQDELNACKAAPKLNFRPEFGLIIGRMVAAQVTSDQAERALKTGDLAPASALPDQDCA